ncbi:uncharacterized protein [Asterias amurensis]|uniref:uncharacterized protein n=1 Tax=Asterias amurensis TaxID=7602 RepID=UPI003AB52D04
MENCPRNSTYYFEPEYNGLTQCIVVVNFIYFIVGVPGNALILAVNRRRAVKTGTRVFMSALAAIDLSLCTMCLFEALFILSYGRLTNTDTDCSYLNTMITALYLGLILSSGFSAVVIAFNRCHAVCNPHQRRISSRKAVAISVACVVTALSAEVVASIVVHIHKGDQVIAAYCRGIPLIAMYIVSMVLVVCFYGKILYFLRRRAKILAQFKSGGNDQEPEISTMSITLEKRHAHSTIKVGTASTRNYAESQSTDDIKGVVVKDSPKLSDLSQKQPKTGPLVQDAASVSRPNSERTSPRPTLVKKAFGPQVERHLERPQVRPQKTDNKITTNLLLVTLSFFLLSLPFVGTSVSSIKVTNKTGGENAQDGSFLDDTRRFILWHLVFLKSMLNPIIYAVVDARFRAECRALLRRLKCCCHNQ